MEKQTQKRIQELEEEFKKELCEYGASYEVFESTMQGNTKLNGKHLSVLLPAKVRVAETELAKVVEKYYGRIFGIGKASPFSIGGIKQQEIVMNLEPGYDPDHQTEKETK